MKLLMVRSDNCLMPAYGSDKDKFNKLKEGSAVQVEIKRHRNLLHHRKFFAILKLVCDNSDKWEVPEQLLIALKIELGYVNIVKGLDGVDIVAPGSIRFETMDQDKFSEFYEPAVKILADEIKVSIQEIEEMHLNYL